MYADCAINSVEIPSECQMKWNFIYYFFGSDLDVVDLFLPFRFVLNQNERVAQPDPINCPPKTFPEFNANQFRRQQQQQPKA